MVTFEIGIFANNYYRSGLGGFNGEKVDGSAKDNFYYLDPLLDGHDCGLGEEHSQVHAYYHGTINELASDDGDGCHQGFGMVSQWNQVKHWILI